MPANTDEQAFLDRIAATPADYAPHGVYADWLDENDRPEEADWHRAWSTAKAAEARAWFDKFAEDNSGTRDDPDGYNRRYVGQEIIDIGVDYLRTGHAHTQYGMSLQEAMYDKATRKAFWANLALVTGVCPLQKADTPFDGETESDEYDDYGIDEYPFSCTC